ncbi:arginine--tRNA ligase [Caerostris darwini]|uniref:Probable arginine--tRNA ligase, mitochondrial n=1 Tax=Caerostris darwini TaxID=1538125 RepID=A0AAV4QJQ4_9ARAC|nr:arginine--tRNA ligase [Caerostris darwini]
MNILQKSNVISSIVRVNKFKSKEPQLFLPWKTLTHVLSPVDDLRNPAELVKLLRNQGLPTKEGIIDITLCKQPLSIVFTVDKHVFSKIVLIDICANEEIIAKSSCLFQGVSPKKILVESWSPKIGEMIKMSHFRSVIHSNFVTNISRAVGHDVKKIAHVADWGLESASLLRGFQQFGRKELLSDNAVEHLFKISKAANLHYENDLTFQNNVKLCYEKMKEGNDETLSEWNDVKDYFLKHYDSIYERIGLTFDDRLLILLIQKK